MSILPKAAVGAYIRGIAEMKMNQKTSENGEIVVHTGLYEWDDNTIRNVPQSKSREIPLFSEEMEEDDEYEEVESEDVYDSEPITLRSNQLGRVG